MNVVIYKLIKLKKILLSMDFDIGAKLKKLLSVGSLTTFSCSDLLQTNSFTILAERINFWRFTSHFESVSRGAFFATLKVTSIRKLRPESWGFFCPVNTPGGGPCGLLNHLSRSCFVSDKSFEMDESLIYDFGVVPPSRDYFTGSPVFYNGRFLGSTHSPAQLARSLREYRATNDLCFEIFHSFGKGIDECVSIFDNISILLRPVYNLRLKKPEWIGMKEQVYLNIGLNNYDTKDAYNDYDKLFTEL